MCAEQHSHHNPDYGIHAGGSVSCSQRCQPQEAELAYHGLDKVSMLSAEFHVVKCATLGDISFCFTPWMEFGSRDSPRQKRMYTEQRQNGDGGEPYSLADRSFAVMG